MKAYVICNNDNIEFVILDDLQLAAGHMKTLEKVYDERNQGRGCMPFWHIHAVDAFGAAKADNTGPIKAYWHPKGCLSPIKHNAEWEPRVLEVPAKENT